MILTFVALADPWFLIVIVKLTKSLIYIGPVTFAVLLILISVFKTSTVTLADLIVLFWSQVTFTQLV